MSLPFDPNHLKTLLSKRSVEQKSYLPQDWRNFPTKKTKEISKVKAGERHKSRLLSAKFRVLNEYLYKHSGEEALEYFKNNIGDFDVYHAGFNSQLSKWPVNPLDVLIKDICLLDPNLTIADMGCGKEAKLSHCVPQIVHSFDLVSSNPEVVACDIQHTPLDCCSVDIVVFCLSLMGTNFSQYLREANRILKNGGILKIAEVSSRFSSLDKFHSLLDKLGFRLSKTRRKSLYEHFILLEYNKYSDPSKKSLLPSMCLKPCLYKKRTGAKRLV